MQKILIIEDDIDIAAQSLDRRYIGIELNAEYCALAGARIGGGNT